MRIQSTGYDYGRIIGSPISQQTEAYLNRHREISRANLSNETLMQMDQLYQANVAMTQFTDERLLEHIHNQTQGVVQQRLGYYPSTATLRAAEVADTRWIMAHPTLQTLYQQGVCDGYGDDYIHVESIMPELRRDYLLATHGIMNDNGVVTKYQDTMMRERDRLSTAEKQNWCDMYGVIDEAILDGNDVTSRHGNTL